MPAPALRPRAPASPPRISKSRVPRGTACAASCSSTASNRPGSPRAWRSRGRCAWNYAKMNSPRRNGMLGTRTLIGAAAFTLALAAQAQTKWDMPTPYSDGEFHTRNVRTFVEDVQKASGGKLRPGQHLRVPPFAVRQRGSDFRGGYPPVRRRRLRSGVAFLPGAEAG